MTGRPSDYTDALAVMICQHIADGLSLRAIAEVEGMPSKETVRRWLRDNPAFRAQYAVARDEQADVFAEEIVDIADTESDSQKARVRIDARKWVASKLKPKKYGDKVALVGGGPGDAPIRMDLSGLSDEELEALERIRSKLADAGGDQGGEASAGG